MKALVFVCKYKLLLLMLADQTEAALLESKNIC